MAGNVLVTGGTGFIGGYLTHALVEKGYSVTAYGRGRPRTNGFDWHRPDLEVVTADLADRVILREALRNKDVIFHKASSYLSQTSANNRDLYQANIGGTQSLIDAISESDQPVKQVIFGSSISVYGEGRYECDNCGHVRPPARTTSSVKMLANFEPVCPHCGNHIIPVETTEDDVLNGKSSYAISKQVQEEMLLQAASRLGFSITILRYATVYGPGQRVSNPYVQFIDAIVGGGKIIIHEDGLQKRDFIYVDDVVSVNLRALESPVTAPRVLNIGTGVETSLIDFVETAGRCMRNSNSVNPSDPQIQITNRLIEGDIRHCRIDLSRARKELPLEDSRTLQCGLHAWLKTLHGPNKVA